MDSTADKSEGGSPSRKKRRKPIDAEPVLDIGYLFGDHKFKIESRETRAEIAARLNIEQAKVNHELRKDFVLFLLVSGIVVVASGACLFIVLSNRYPLTIQNSAMALLAVIVSGGVGYVTGKSSK